jgi:hypothetical protein
MGTREFVAGGLKFVSFAERVATGFKTMPRWKKM